MSNGEIYRKTLVFSIRRFLFDILAFVVLGALAGLGFLIADKATNRGLVGLVIGLIIGVIFLVVFLRYVGYTYKAGQIAMMTRGVTEDALPEDVLKAGKKEVKERFVTVAVYFAATSAIKGIFNELGKGIMAVGKAVGGDSGEAVGSVISSVVQTIVAYLCDCCLGWVFYRKDVNAFKATCEGAVLFFKHGKTFAKNMGRVFGYGVVSFLVIGGAFTGVLYMIGSRFPDTFEMLSREVGEAIRRGDINPPELLRSFLTSPVPLTVVCSLLGAIILWTILHNTFVRPYVLVGVLRNYMQSGIADIPSESSFALLEQKSRKFAKLRKKAEGS